jgi:outer membrane protein TolC
MNAVNLPRLPGHRRVLTALLAASLVTAGGCAHIPDLGQPLALKPMAQPGSAKSISVSAEAWPGDHGWQAYGDPQPDALLEEALRDSPDLEQARGRLRQAGAVVQGAGAALMPEVTGNAAFTQEKQSYNYLIRRLPRPWPIMSV